jgi:protease I
MADLHGCVLAILVEDGAQLAPIEQVRQRLHDVGARVHLLGAHSSPAKVAGGKPLPVDALAAGVSARYYDGLVIPGAINDRDPSVDSEQLIGLVQAFAQERRPIGVIGDGIHLLADAGLLEGRSVACTRDVMTLIEKSGARRVSEPVMNDRVIITACDISTLPKFCEVYAAEVESYRKRDYVDEVSLESFPGSDAPSTSAI